MATPHQIPQAVLEKFREASIKVQPITLSERISFDIEGEVNRVDNEWYLGMSSVVAVTAEGDRDPAQHFAILELSIADNDALTKILNLELSNFSNRGIKSCKLTVRSDLLNEKIFEDSGDHQVALYVVIEFEDGCYSSSPIDAFLAINKSTTRRVRRKLGGELSTTYISFIPLCFAMFSITFTPGLSVDTVCSIGCVSPASCGCIFGGAAVCSGWHPCVCGYSILGFFVPVRIFLILALIILGIIPALILLVIWLM